MTRRRRKKILDSARTFTDPPHSMTPPWEEGDDVFYNAFMKSRQKGNSISTLKLLQPRLFPESGPLPEEALRREGSAFRQEMEKRK